MFNEREALRLRLEQLNEAEVKVIREYQIERDNIYAKLRELDRPSSFNNKKKDLHLKRTSSRLLRKPPHCLPEFQMERQGAEGVQHVQAQKLQNCVKRRLKH